MGGRQMQVTFNGQDRTLREIVALALSAGWKAVHVTKTPGSLFGHIVAVPVAVPVSPQRHARAGSGSAFFDVPRAGGAAGAGNAEVGEMEMVERASSRCRMPTFGSRVDLPFGAEPAGEEVEAFTAVRCPSALVPFTQSVFISPGYVPAPATSATATYIAHNSPYPAGAPSDAVPAAATSRALARPAAAAPAFAHVSRLSLSRRSSHAHRC
jgi:hypothetical protein